MIMPTQKLIASEAKRLIPEVMALYERAQLQGNHERIEECERP